MTKSSSTYKDSGVDIDAGNALVDRIKPLAKKTKRSGLVSGVGGFSGLFAIPPNQYKEPVLVASTDGVGTKLKLALDTDVIDGLGQDLVAMCVNDLLCCGATPLFFLDYYATGKLDVDQAERVIASIANALDSIDCTLLGGETAEMPGLYNKGDFDIAGFSVGVVEKANIIDGSDVALGDVVIALPSAGVHSNGFSLVRKILADAQIDLNQNFNGQSLISALMAPTTLYVKPALSVLKNFSVHAMAHITGGGLVENLPRVIPQSCKIELQAQNIRILPIFEFLQQKGNVAQDEMWRVFNMGVGFTMIVSKEDASAVTDHLNAMGVPAYPIGHVSSRQANENSVVFC